ncbi:FOXA3 factor, partial [Polypterus senegalus]
MSDTGTAKPGMAFTIDYLLYDKGKRERTFKKLPSHVDIQEVPSTQNENQLHHSEAKVEEGSVKDENTGVASKPAQSYIALISSAILSCPEKKLLLSDIYQWIMDHYPYFKSKDKNWRNSVRHNLSLNECFVKAGRSENGKGHYWAIHPANYQDFSKGDYHRRRTRRRIRRIASGFGYQLLPLNPLPRPRLWADGLSCWSCLGSSLPYVPNKLSWSWPTLPGPVPVHTFL